ncbi:MAG: HD domain-containing protein, partial [Lachnospiraceae bacterium]|nr:HD domain-containing protein [Lachnospiraceae bacterium]
CDGIAYEYAEKNKIISSAHDFEKDIIACAQNISKRYRGSKKRSETLEGIALTIFDSTRKIHGLGKRERLLLQISTILHDCGKYISLVNLGECSYSIIMATEIIGLSHLEREIVANVVKYNHLEFDYYEIRGSLSALDNEAYLKIAKLTAILRLANGLDRSHKQKFGNIKISLKDDELAIMVDTTEDITLEKGLFGARADFFREVYNIRPVIKRKRM